MANNETLSTLARNWRTALKALFPAGTPETCTWDGIDGIVETLARIAKPNTGHMFFPDHGGDDFVAVSRSKDDLNIELFTDETRSVPRILKPLRLQFVCQNRAESMAYFLLEFASISKEPEFPDSSGEYAEEFAQAPNGKKFTLNQWNNDADDADERLPKNTRHMVRYWRAGTIAIFSKESPYNNSQIPGFDGYFAEHMKPERFGVIVNALVTAVTTARS